MIDTNKELNIPDSDLEFVQSSEQLGQILGALGIVEPMFRPDDADPAGMVLPMLTPGPELNDGGDDTSQFASEYSAAPQSALAPQLENIERLAHLAETMGHIRPDLLNALSQNPMLSGFVPGSLGNGSGPDFARPDSGPDQLFGGDQESGIASALSKKSWAMDGGAPKIEGNERTTESGATEREIRADYPDGRTITITTTSSEDSVRTTWETVNADGSSESATIITNREDGSTQTYRMEIGPLGQPNPNGPTSGPGAPGGVFDPEWWTDSIESRFFSSNGKSLEEEVAELSAFQPSTELTWQERLQLEDMMVTNPGLSMAAGLQSDTFAFSTPEIGADRQAGPDPDPVGPALMYDASAAAPALASGLAAQVAGDFPVDTIDPDDGLIGGPLMTDMFLI